MSRRIGFDQSECHRHDADVTVYLNVPSVSSIIIIQVEKIVYLLLLFINILYI